MRRIDSCKSTHMTGGRLAAADGAVISGVAGQHSRSRENVVVLTNHRSRSQLRHYIICLQIISAPYVASAKEEVDGCAEASLLPAV